MGEPLREMQEQYQSRHNYDSAADTKAARDQSGEEPYHDGWHFLRS